MNPDPDRRPHPTLRFLGLLALGGACLFAAGPADASANGRSATAGTRGANPRLPQGRAAAAAGFRNPINTGADPTMTYYKGNYYVATTQGDTIRMWRSKSIATLLTAPATTVWQDANPSRRAQIWAPALYRFRVGGGYRWYLYYTASDGTDATHRMYVLESKGTSPLGPYHFKAKIADSAKDTWAIDGEPFRVGGALYFAWSGEGSRLFVARMSSPWRLGGHRVALPAKGGCPEVREGPTPLYRGGRTFLTYSACDTGKPDYQIWMKSIRTGQNPLNPKSWTQHPRPIFTRNDTAGVWGPGHHFFFKSPDGRQDWIAYHAKNTSAYDYGWRTTRVQRFTWNKDGTPKLGRPVALGTTLAPPSGDPGPAPKVINDADLGTGDLHVSYAGPWDSGSGCGDQCFRGDDHWSGRAGATATFHFTGTRIALLSVRDTGNGIAAISVDGGPEQRVDYYGRPRVGEQPNYVSPALRSGAHTVTVRVTGDRNAASSGTVVSIDRAEIHP